MSDHSTGISSRTLGCRLNAHESEIMEANARAAGIGPAVIVNTCAVTSEAVRQSRQAVRRARRARPEAQIIVTGCAAHIDAEGFASMPEADVVIGNQSKTRPEVFSDLVGEREPRTRPGPKVRHHIAGRKGVRLHDGRARGCVQIQTGCDHACTFCIIPQGRGAGVSSRESEILCQVGSLADAGYRQIVLTGVDIASWGQDLPGAPDLGGLVERILESDSRIDLLRLSSLDPRRVGRSLVRAYASQRRLAPHAHLSLQAGDDLILKRMRRRHLRAEAIDACSALRAARPDIALGADLIAGFPTETEQMFANTLSLVDGCGLDYLHVFPFSARSGTAAERMPQLPRQVVAERARQLRQAGQRRLRAWLDRHVGRICQVIVGTGALVRLADYAPARLSFSADRAVVNVRLAGHDGSVLLADPA